MPETFFVADLHLSPKQPITIARCLEFFASLHRDGNRAQSVDALYILGDLFEVWLGDDDDEPTYQQILLALHKLTSSGVPVFIMHGNRDFLLGEKFAASSGCQLIYDDAYVIDLYGVPTLLMHGDTLCTLDVDYQTYRQQVRQPQWQQQFGLLPLAQRRILAQQARNHSQTVSKKMQSSEIMDVTPEAVVSALETHKVYSMIHGHTHRPAIHNFTINGQTASRRVLGDWRDETAIILSCTPDGIQLIDLAV